MNELVIESGRMEGQYWRDLWERGELLLFLTRCEFLVRYKQTVVGILWAVIRPVVGMGVFTLLFGMLAKLPTDGSAPYSLMVYAAMLPWQFVTLALAEASNSLIAHPNLITKIYFPRLIIPISSVLTCFADTLVGFVVLFAMMPFYRYSPDWHIVFIPAFMALAFALPMGAGLWFCALNVKYRDFRQIAPFIPQLGLFISPVGFSSSIVPERGRILYSLNPMVGIIDGFRWALLRGQSFIYWPSVWISTVITVLILMNGIWRFRKMENTFADEI